MRGEDQLAATARAGRVVLVDEGAVRGGGAAGEDFVFVALRREGGGVVAAAARGEEEVEPGGVLGLVGWDLGIKVGRRGGEGVVPLLSVDGPLELVGRFQCVVGLVECDVLDFAVQLFRWEREWDLVEALGVGAVVQDWRAARAGLEEIRVDAVRAIPVGKTAKKTSTWCLLRLDARWLGQRKAYPILP